MSSTKIFLIILAAVILAAAGWIVGLKFKLSAAQAENTELTAQIAGNEARIAKAEAAIKEQNAAAERMRAERAAAQNKLKEEYARLNKKYTLLKDKAALSVKEAADDCKASLALIYEAQEEFCYE